MSNYGDNNPVESQKEQFFKKVFDHCESTQKVYFIFKSLIFFNAQFVKIFSLIRNNKIAFPMLFEVYRCCFFHL